VDFVARGRCRERFLQQIFGLGITAVGKENLRLRDRIDFLGDVACRVRAGRAQVGVSAVERGRRRGCSADYRRRASFFASAFDSRRRLTARTASAPISTSTPSPAPR